MPIDTGKRIVTKTVTKTPLTLPGEILKVKLGNAGKYDYLRVFFGGPTGETPVEYVLHRPVGKTPLGGDEWVLSNPGEYSLLLQRENNPNEKDLLVARDAHKKDLAVAAGLISVDDDNIISYPTGMKRNEFLKPIKSTVKGQVKDRNKQISDWKASSEATRSKDPPLKLNFNEVLKEELKSMEDSVDAEAEIAFSEFMSKKSTIEASEVEHPDDYETLGGTYGDTEQVPLLWAKGLHKGQVQQLFAKHLAKLLHTLDTPEDVSVVEPSSSG